MERLLLNSVNRLKKDTRIREIYLFGSVARGDHDQYSDMDVLVVIDDCSEDEYVQCKDMLAHILNIPVSWLSVYRIAKIKRMHGTGSYFLWHIKKEGKLLYSRDGELGLLLSTLPQYSDVRKDLEEYSSILLDVKKETNNKYICIEYELSVLASLVRNTCIAIAYLDGEMNFGRTSVVMYCFSKYKVNVTLEEYEQLYQYRLFYTGKIRNVPAGEIAQLEKWINIERVLLEIAEKGIKNYEKEII